MKAFVKKLRSGRYNVVIEGEKGIVTSNPIKTMKHRRARDQRVFARSYGWQ